MEKLILRNQITYLVLIDIEKAFDNIGYVFNNEGIRFWF